MTYEPDDIELKQLVDRWVAQWNEPDAEERRRLIEAVWADNGYQTLVRPPQAMRDSADELGMPWPEVEIRGHTALFARVTRAYERFVATGEFAFERDGELVRHLGGTVALNWVMRSHADGTVVGGGLDVLTFADDGRVRSSHQFVS
ncbi:hypothetical protein [Nocardia sp. NPDC020380]|uniref:hypothetical protein n=1 Tax=Nocardia sp. NPDC020380 TaxID=3364309 RepID=UPI0037AE3620